VNGNYNSGFPFDVAGSIRQKRYALLNAQLSFEPVNIKGLRLSLWGDLTDHDYIQGSFADKRRRFGLVGRSDYLRTERAIPLPISIGSLKAPSAMGGRHAIGQDQFVVEGLSHPKGEVTGLRHLAGDGLRP
jgi:hypothetical protein